MINDDENVGANNGALKANSGARLIPRITIQAFCEHSQTAQMIESLVQDRRLSRVALTTHNGGVEGAIETYKANPTPNLIIIETSLLAEEILSSLNRLAEVCDTGTELLVLGQINDVVLYRELKNFGVSEYLVLPTSANLIVNAICEIFVPENAKPIGRSVAFIAAKGGAGASTIAHNSAWSIAQNMKQDVLIIDMDLAFGTLGLNFNQDPATSISDALFSNEKIDAIMLDRLMSKAASQINLLTAPSTLERTYEIKQRDFENIIELSQQSVPVVILDIPHIWSDWVKYTLAMVDEIVIVAEPDLANLRNAKNLIDILESMRPDEAKPMLIMNKIGVPKRPEIAAAEFASSIECQLFAEIHFDAATFGIAANNGQMICEVNKNHKADDVFNRIGQQIMGRETAQSMKKIGGLNIADLMKFLKLA